MGYILIIALIIFGVIIVKNSIPSKSEIDRNTAIRLSILDAEDTTQSYIKTTIEQGNNIFNDDNVSKNDVESAIERLSGYNDNNTIQVQKALKSILKATEERTSESFSSAKNQVKQIGSRELRDEINKLITGRYGLLTLGIVVPAEIIEVNK